MSTIQISIPDSLLGRMTSEEIRHFLQEQIQRLDSDEEFFISGRTLAMIEHSVQNLQQGNVGAPIDIARITTLLNQLP
ncbi:MAG: hypothetical protein ACOVSW_09095 [Candidatus Kapaibacteriota bacterium]